MTDQIIQTKTCPISGKEFTITQGDLDFYDKISPTFAGQRFQIPTPTLHPEERHRKRLSFRNERNLYRRKCDASGKDIISIYSPDKAYKVYDQKIRRSDSRDPLSYDQEFDFSKTFTENFKELMTKVPRLGIMNTSDNDNSQYTNFTARSNNIYMCSDVYQCEETLYSTTIKNLKDCIDVLDVVRAEECYECSYSSDLYGCKYVTFSKGCRDSHHLYSCIGVNNSSYCVGLTNKQYCILNKEYTKEEYVQILNNIKHDDALLEYKKLISLNQPIIRVINCENSEGNHLENCNNVQKSYFLQNVSNSKYIFIGYDMDQCMDTSIHNIDCYRDYEAISGGKLKNCAFNVLGWGGYQIYYNQDCIDCSNIFGCISLRNKSYCIFNKQYTKEEYEILVAKIITHMVETKERGEFFHPSLSPFGYNETVAQEYYPINKGDLESFGYHRSDYQAPAPVADKIIEGKDLPTTIDQVSDDILKTAIRCEVTGKLFRIIPQELAFYRKHHLPLPRRHPDQRHLDRLALRK